MLSNYYAHHKYSYKNHDCVLYFTNVVSKWSSLPGPLYDDFSNFPRLIHSKLPVKEAAVIGWEYGRGGNRYSRFFSFRHVQK